MSKIQLTCDRVVNDDNSAVTVIAAIQYNRHRVSCSNGSLSVKPVRIWFI